MAGEFVGSGVLERRFRWARKDRWPRSSTAPRSSCWPLSLHA